MILKSLSVRSVLLTSTAAAVVFGFAEWLVIGGLGFGLPQGEACRTILAIVILYGLFGLTLGALSAVSLRIRKLQDVAVSLPLAMLIALAVYRERQSLLFLAAAFALGWFCHMVFKRVVLRYPLLWRPRLWCVLQGLVVAVALILTTFEAPNRINIGIAVGAACATAFLPIWNLTRGCMDLWRFVTGIVVVVITCWLLGFQVLVVGPNFAADTNRPSVLLITVDTLRADHVGAYGYINGRTPHLDSLAKKGILFREVVTPHRTTGPSHTSILTGLLPENHGVLQNMERISQSIPTLADLLSTKGYVTASFVSAVTTVDSACGLPSRFHVYDDDIGRIRWLPEEARGTLLLSYMRGALRVLGFDIFPHVWYRTGSKTTDSAISWLEHNNKVPFFVWVHLFDPHLPYRPPREYLSEASRDYKGPASEENWYFLDASDKAKIVSSPRNMKQMVALYDAEIAYADQQVGRLVEAAQLNAPNGDLVTIVTADHGESQGEHKIYWSRDLYDPTLLVPLIMVLPDSKFDVPLVIEDQVSLTDIAPTLLELLDIEPLKTMDGRSLMGLIKKDLRMPVSAKSEIYPTPSQFHRPAVSIRYKGWKLIVRGSGWEDHNMWFAKESLELYDLHADPSEEINLASTSSKELKELKEEFERHQDSLRSRDLNLTPAMKERLRGLGYVR